MTLRVLVVEDEFLIAADLEMMVTDFGHQVVGVADTVEVGLDLARKHRPDLVTVDLKLKHGGQGEDLARRLRDELQIRSVFVSGNLDNRVRGQLAHLDPIGFIGKPISPHLLQRVLDSADPDRQ